MGQMITPITHENPINSPLTTKQLNTFIPANFDIITICFINLICKKLQKKNNDRFVWPGHKKSDLLISNDRHSCWFSDF